MKITHVVETLGRGGLERMVIDLAEAQVIAGHACTIICIFNAGELSQEAVSKGIKVVVCNKKRSIDLNALIKLRRTIQSAAPNIIHTHNAVPNYYVVFSVLFMKSSYIINTRHGMGSKDPNSKLERRYKKTMNKTKYVVAVCDAARSKFVSDKIVDADKCVVIKNGIKVDDFTSLQKDYSINNANGIITIGCVGRLNWAKDFYTLLDAFHLLTIKFDNVRLLIVGGGELEERLKNHCNDIGIDNKVSFLGDTEDVKPILPSIDIFVSSSVSEGYSIALLEACAVGIPIVATDVGGNSEIVKDRINGFVVLAKDKKAIAEKISLLICDNKARDEFAKSGQDWVKQHGDVRCMLEGYNNLYEKCIKSF